MTETALTRCVMKARRAVGGDAESQNIIRTVHGHGYHFIADTVEIDPLATKPATAAAETPPPEDNNEPADRSFYQELQHRKVLRTVGIYIGLCWIVIEASSVLLQAFEMPGWVLRGMIGAALLGLPVTLVLSWIYNITSDPDGSGTSKTRGPASADGRRKTDFAVIGVLTVALILSLYNNLKPEPGEREFRQFESLAVLPVENLTGDQQLAWVETGMMSLLNRLLESQGIAVVSDRSIISLSRGRAIADLLAKDSEFTSVLQQTAGATNTNWR